MIMPAREVRVEDLLGRVVRNAAGRPVGQVDDIRVLPEGDDYVVHEILIGELGWLPKLFKAAAQLPTLQALGVPRRYRTRPIPWSWLDLSDPERPCFRRAMP